MKFSHLLLATAAAGLLTGAAAHRLSRGSVADSPGHEPAADPRQAGENGGPEKSRNAPALPAIRSADTPDSLLALPPHELYPRLALWLLDASQQEIAAFWQSYRALEETAGPIKELTFIHWAQLDPRAALAAVAGSEDEHYAWRAWACQDPAGALAAVMARNPNQLKSVASALGEFHPDWVREHWEEIPEEARRSALEGMAKWDAVGNPHEILTFLTGNGYSATPKILKALTSRDPWAAYDWVRDHDSPGSQSARTFTDTLIQEDPEMLEKIAR